MYQLIQDLRNFNKVESAYAFGQYVHFTGIEDNVESIELDNYLYSLGHKDILVEEIYPGIEDVFMNLMERN